MKKQLFKRLLAFSITVFSISSSFAQCHGNQVLVCHISRATGYLVCQCVHQSHLKTYLRNGWTLSSPPVVAKNDPTVTGKDLRANSGSKFRNCYSDKKISGLNNFFINPFQSFIQITI